MTLEIYAVIKSECSEERFSPGEFYPSTKVMKIFLVEENAKIYAKQSYDCYVHRITLKDLIIEALWNELQERRKKE